MAIELRTGRGGKLRSTWYGRYEVNGHRYTINLGVKVAGTPPGSLRDMGDPFFERSRAQAQARLDQLVEEARHKHDSAHLVERLYEIKTGEQIKSVALDRLPEEWAQLPRRRETNERYMAQCKSVLERFVSFVRARNPKAEELVHVTRQVAQDFMQAESARTVAGKTLKVTAKTWNDTLKLLRAVCKHLLPEGSINAFSAMPLREVETVFRKPFTPEELKAIFEASRTDDFARPIIITGICTAMRRGDCCLLKWADVDLARRFITVKTSKTGQTVSIPIFPMLFDELQGMVTRGEYVFPEQATMYLENPDGITWRVRRVFAAAGFKDTELDEHGLKKEGEDPVRGEIHAARKGGLRQASVRDFHSFRVTWVTLALTAGVPLELVQKVTGHKTADIVLKHYFQPGREEFRRTLQMAMPRLLSNGQAVAEKSPKEEILEICRRTDAKSWKTAVSRIAAIAEKM